MNEAIVQKLYRLIEHRNILTDATLKPSEYWSDFCQYFSYVFNLDKNELKYIRRHTYHLTSDIYQRYYFASNDYKDLLIRGYNFFSNLLDGFAYDETEYGIGVDSPSCKISHDALRYLGILVDLKMSLFLLNKPAAILELGGGYGGLARCLLNYCNSCSYVICDLEETLFFSYTYLSNMLGENKVHLIEERLQKENLLIGHVYLTPQSMIHNIQDIFFDLTINQQSLQEMKSKQVSKYLNFIKHHSRYFYSCNLISHEPCIVKDKGLVENLTQEMNFVFGKPVWKGATPDIQHSFGDHIPGIDRILYFCEG